MFLKNKGFLIRSSFLLLPCLRLMPSVQAAHLSASEPQKTYKIVSDAIIPQRPSDLSCFSEEEIKNEPKNILFWQDPVNQSTPVVENKPTEIPYFGPIYRSEGPMCVQCLRFFKRKGKKHRCSRCRKVSYCSRECQKKHWNTAHRLVCEQAAECTNSEEEEKKPRQKWVTTLTFLPKKSGLSQPASPYLKVCFLPLTSLIFYLMSKRRRYKKLPLLLNRVKEFGPRNWYDGYNARTLYAIGRACFKADAYTEAMAFTERALNVAEKELSKKERRKSLPYAMMLFQLGATHVQKENYDQAIQYHLKALKIQLALQKRIDDKKLHLGIANSYGSLGDACKGQGAYDEAIDYYTKSLDIEKGPYGEEPHLLMATSYNSLGLVYERQGEFDQAIQHYLSSLEMLKKLYKNKPHSNIAGSCSNLGNAYKSKGVYDQAIQYHLEALKIQLALQKKVDNKKYHLSIATSYNSLGLVYKLSGAFKKAIQHHRSSLEMLKKLYGKRSDPAIINSYNNLGNAYDEQKTYDQAIKNYLMALKTHTQIYGSKPHSSIATLYVKIGNAYWCKGDLNEAIKYSLNALEIFEFEEVRKESSPLSIATVCTNLGAAYQKRNKRRKGRYDQDEAIRYFLKALESMEKVHGKLHLSTASSCNNLGSAYFNKKKYGQAIRYFSRAHQIWLATLGKDHSDTKIAAKNLAIARGCLRN